MTISKRTFGVEIEHGNRQLGFDAIEHELTKAGFSKWANFAQDGTGVEVRSPILSGQDGLDELAEVMRLLKSIGGYVTYRDGLHVHHGGKEFLDSKTGERNIGRLLHSWANNQAVIDKLVAKRRTRLTTSMTNAFGHVVDNPFKAVTKMVADEQIKRLAQLKKEPYSDRPYTVAQKCHTINRFYALNIHSLNTHGTIEFRQHEGTLNVDRAIAWVKFGQRFIEAVLEGGEIPIFRTTTNLLNYLDIDDHDSSILRRRERRDASANMR